MSISVQNIIDRALENDRFTAYDVRTIESELLRYWNTSLNEEVDNFWDEVNSEGIPIQRNQLLRKIEKRGRFLDTEEAFEVFNYVMYGMAICEKLEYNANLLNMIIDKDLSSRVQFVQNCLRKKSVANSEYLRCGACYAFLKRTDQFQNYFKNIDESQLLELLHPKK